MKKAIITLLLASAFVGSQAQKAPSIKPSKDTTAAPAQTPAAAFYIEGDKSVFEGLVWMLNNPSKVTNVDRERMIDFILNNVKQLQAKPKAK